MEKFYSVNETAKKLNVDSTTIRRHIKEGRMKAIISTYKLRSGYCAKCYMISESEINRYISDRIISRPIQRLSKSRPTYLADTLDEMEERLYKELEFIQKFRDEVKDWEY